MNRNVIIPFFLVISLAASSAFAHRWCWTSTQKNTYGWQLMTPDERKAHQAKLVSFTRYSTCTEYVDGHHTKMEERAREKGFALPVMKKNPCDTMRTKGTFR